MDLRLYEPSDRAACVSVFDSLTPDLLDGACLASFKSWLDNPAGPYFVMEHDQSVVGCGGYEIAADGTTARLSWGMVHRKHQRMGLGRFLLMYRIREIGRAGNATLAVADSPRPSAGFFEKQGFRISRIVNDGYAPGFDRVELTRKLIVCS